MTTDRDILQEMIRELSEIASAFDSLKGEAYNHLSAPEYTALRMHLEMAQADVEATIIEARRRARLLES